MKYCAVIALISAFCGAMAEPVKFVADIHVSCEDGTHYLLEETGNSTSDACQKNLNISPVTRVLARNGLKVVRADAVRKSATNVETKPGTFVYSPVNEIEKGELNGTTMVNAHEYQSLDNLKACGGNETVVVSKNITIAVSRNGKNTTCKGGAIIRGQAPSKVNFKAVITVQCADKSNYVLVESGNSTNDACQKNLFISPTVEVVSHPSLFKFEKSEATTTSATNTEVANKSGTFVYKPQMEIKAGPLAGTKLDNSHEYQSLDNLLKCGGKQLAVTTHAISVNVTNPAGKTTTCTGSAIIV